MINAIILIPEITKGMKSVGSKSLLDIKKKVSVLEYQVQSLKNIDKNIKITVCTGFESEKIVSAVEQYQNIDVIYNPRYKLTNQGYSIKLYLEQYSSTKDLLILNSGVLIKNKCINKTMLSNKSKIFVLNKEKENFNLGCSKESKLEYIFYDLPEIWSECVYLNDEALTKLRHMFTNSNVDQMYLFEIINEIIHKDTIVEKEYIDKKSIMKILNIKDITKAKTFI